MVDIHSFFFLDGGERWIASHGKSYLSGLKLYFNFYLSSLYLLIVKNTTLHHYFEQQIAFRAVEPTFIRPF